MSFQSDFSDMLPHTVFVSKKLGTDSYNAPVYGSSVSYQARVVYGALGRDNMGGRSFRNSQGEILAPTGVLWITTTTLLDLSYKFEFLRDTDPSPADYVELNPLHIDAWPDENGMYFTKVFFE